MDTNILSKKINDFIRHHKEFILLPTEIIEISDLFIECSQQHAGNTTDGPIKQFSIEVLSYVLERMFWSRFEDSRYVGLLLEHIYRTDIHILAHLVGVCLYISSWEHCESNICLSLQNEKSCVLFEYFIRHAYTAKLLMWGCRLPLLYEPYSMKAPIQIAVDKLDLPLLLQMMKYGILLSYPSYPDMFRGFFCEPWSPQRILLELIDKILKLNSDLLKVEDLALTPRRMTKYTKMISCCDLLLSDAPNWNPDAIFGFLKSFRYEIKHFVEVFSANVVPDLRNYFTAPMNLKQACRLSIRKHLNENWMLPNAIADLDIPRFLKMYLDITL